MRIAVLDTSALLRLFVPDGPVPEGVEEIVEQAWRAEAILLAPEQVLSEAAQVLLKKQEAGILEASEVEEILTSILSMPLETVGHREILADSLHLAEKRKLTVYDALFVVLASKRGAELFTADRKLARAHGKTTG